VTVRLLASVTLALQGKRLSLPVH